MSADLTYRQAVDALILNFRLDFDPVGIRFIFDEKDTPKYPVTHKTKKKMTYCQFLAASRSARYSLLMPPGRLLCKNAQAVFGFREIDPPLDTKIHKKYLLEDDLCLEASKKKEMLPPDTLKAIYMAPVDMFDDIEETPDVVFLMVVPYQAYHILNDYMGATGKPNLSFFMTPNSAVCGGTVFTYNKNTANMNTMCAGSKTSGKTEMNYMNLFIPGGQFKDTAGQLLKRIKKTGGPSLLGRGGQAWPGLEACTMCPMMVFDKV